MIDELKAKLEAEIEAEAEALIKSSHPLKQCRGMMLKLASMQAEAYCAIGDMIQQAERVMSVATVLVKHHYPDPDEAIAAYERIRNANDEAKRAEQEFASMNESELQ